MPCPQGGNLMTCTPLLLSAWVAFWASLLGLVTGVPVALWLSRAKSVWVPWIETALLLPVLFPPTVTGYLLLLIFGPYTALGQVLQAMGIPVLFTPKAMVLGAWLVSAPLFVRTAQAAFAMVPTELFEVARLEGLSRWQVCWRVVVPLCWPGLVAGWVLMVIRALGDFGVTLMVSGNVPGRTLGVSVALYNAMMAGDTKQTQILAWALVGVTLSLLALVHLAGVWRPKSRGEA